MAEVRDLPGWPKKKLVQDVKSCLWRSLRCRPQMTDRLWRDTWEWASAIKDQSGLLYLPKYKRMAWPSAHEIATQYILLGLLEMRTGSNLRLPSRASEIVPPCILERVHLFHRIEAVREPQNRMAMPFLLTGEAH